MIIWSTDLHLNFLKTYNSAKYFAEYVSKEYPDAKSWIITGDISEANTLHGHLQELAEGFKKPIYFVLGNHDFYGSSWERVEKQLHSLVINTPNLFWLDQGPILSNRFSITGTTGWYDATFGNSNSSVELNDFELISELKQASFYRYSLLEVIKNKSKTYARALNDQLKKACKESDLIIVATHVAPYAQASWFEGKMSNSSWLPWFTSGATGEVLDIYAKQFEEKTFIVLCGHNHSSGIYSRFNNLTVYTGGASYYKPDVCGQIDPYKRIVTANDLNNKKVIQSY